MRPSSDSIRVALYYALLFAAVGVQMPFWPVWLVAHGLTPADIGWVVAVLNVVRLLVPLVGAMVDRRGDRRGPMVVLAAGAALSWALFAVSDGFAQILAVSAIAGTLWAAFMPVGDSLAMMAAAQRRIDYGRVRLWGSAAFILAATQTGRLLEGRSPGLLVWLIAGLLGGTALACRLLPDLKAPKPAAGSHPPLRPLLTSRPYLLFLAAGACNQASHLIYYTFATLHWRAAGIDDVAIGWLWAEGVLAEIVLFAVSAPVVRRVGPAGLLVAAGVAGVVRWTVLGATTWLPALIVAQLLHAATFGCAHLGAMNFLTRAVPPGLAVRAQTIYAAVALGALLALLSPMLGRLYQEFAGGAFFAMAVFSLATAALARKLGHLWHGGKLAA